MAVCIMFLIILYFERYENWLLTYVDSNLKAENKKNKRLVWKTKEIWILTLQGMDEPRYIK